MQFYIKSREEVERFNNHRVHHVIISIYSPQKNGYYLYRQPEPKTNIFTEEVLHLYFDDMKFPTHPDQIERWNEYREVHGEWPYFLFNRDHAIEAKNLIEKWKGKIEEVIVHCAAGISRSAGLATALRDHYSPDEELIHTRKIDPNEWVIKTMKEVLNDNISS